MKQKKSLLYWASVIATAAAILSVWAHLATSISIYEVRPKGSTDPFSWEFAGVMLASAINIFVIFIAIGSNKLDDYIESIPTKTKADKAKREKYNKTAKSLNRYLNIFGFLEIFGNIYFQIAGELDKAKFGYYDLSYIDYVAWAAVGIWGATPTLIAISGAKLMRVFSLDVYAGEEKEPSWLGELISEWFRSKLTKIFAVDADRDKIRSGFLQIKNASDKLFNADAQSTISVNPQPSREEPQEPVKAEPYFKD